MIILYTDIRTIKHDTFGNLLEYIPQAGKGRIMKYGFTKGKYRAVSGELLARHAICAWKGIDTKRFAAQFVIDRTKSGKPFFLGENFHYSISHSGNFVVCAADSEEIGVDIEYVRKCNYLVAKKLFNDAELDELYNAVSADRKFIEIWTRKESFIKADGRGFGYPDIKNIALDGVEIRSFHIHEDYAAAVCFKSGDNSGAGEIPETSIKEIVLNEIFP